MIIFHLLFSAATLLFIAYVVPGIEVASLFSAFVAAIILGIVNITIRPLLLVLTFPITIFTLGLFSLVINALMVQLVGTIVKGFTVADFRAALYAALILMIGQWFVHWIEKQKVVV